MIDRPIYLDNAASTQPSPEVCKTVLSVMRDVYGNPSSLHRMGVEGEREMNQARSHIARVLGVSADSIFFTGGGTEANNIAIFGVCRKIWSIGGVGVGSGGSGGVGSSGGGSDYFQISSGVRRVVTSAMEHPSILKPLKAVEAWGWDVTYLPGVNSGAVDIEALGTALDESVALISFAHVNNETGAVLPLDAVRALRDRMCPDALLHIDCAQSFAKLPITPDKSGADIISMSAHKIHGPKGIGALYLSTRARKRIAPHVYGGGQEGGLRPGTENTPAIAGFGVAAREAAAAMENGAAAHALHLKQTLIESIERHGIAYSHIADDDACSPYILALAFHGIPAELMLNHLDNEGVYVSSGAACSSKRAAKTGSHVLAAMGLKDDIIKSAIRFSFSRNNTIDEIVEAADRIKRAASRIRI